MLHNFWVNMGSAGGSVDPRVVVTVLMDTAAPHTLCRDRRNKLCYLQSPGARDVRMVGSEVKGQWRMIRSMGPVLGDESRLDLDRGSKVNRVSWSNQEG